MLNFSSFGARQAIYCFDKAHFGVGVSVCLVGFCDNKLAFFYVEALDEFLWDIRVGIAHFAGAFWVEQYAVIVCCRCENSRHFHNFKISIFHICAQDAVNWVLDCKWAR